MATAKTVAETTQTDRSQTYRVLCVLEGRGLVKRIITNPLEFKAISLPAVTRVLLERRKNELSDTEKDANLLLKRKVKKNRLKQTNDVMLVVPRPEMIIEEIKDDILKCEHKAVTL